jgi:hypothetical protein
LITKGHDSRFCAFYWIGFKINPRLKSNRGGDLKNAPESALSRPDKRTSATIRALACGATLILLFIISIIALFNAQIHHTISTEAEATLYITSVRVILITVIALLNPCVFISIPTYID